MSKESTFIPLAFEWDRESASYKEAFDITHEDEKTAAMVVYEAKKKDPNINAADIVLDAIRNGEVSSNFAAAMLQMGINQWWSENCVGIQTLLGYLDEDE